eukprot:TRINITY_DN2528_c0_g1_i1.p1 TRINITY_DN2528_c0_g1~~TRINITY_DN2528_c0_g1_i1.p1  ORF type:complete len:696 (+),score=35.51 TRINITY_DN2528_c0_g1_i1:106-2193(+)
MSEGSGSPTKNQSTRQRLSLLPLADGGEWTAVVESPSPQGRPLGDPDTVPDLMQALSSPPASRPPAPPVPPPILNPELENKTYTLYKTGEFNGFGFHLDKTTLSLTRVDKGGPADAANIQESNGLILVMVDGIKVDDVASVEENLIGKTQIKLTFSKKRLSVFMTMPLKSSVYSNTSQNELDTPRRLDVTSETAEENDQRFKVKARWDRALSASLFKVQKQKDAKPPQESVSIMSLYTTRTISHAGYETIALAFCLIVVTCLMCLPLIVWLRVGSWYTEISPKYYEVSSRARTDWAGMEWFALVTAQLAITISMVPMEAWRWIVTLKVIGTAAILMWINTTKIEGRTSDFDYLPGILILICISIADVAYLYAVKRSNSWVILFATTVSIGYIALLYFFILRPYEASGSWLKLLIRAVALPVSHHFFVNILTTVGRHLSNPEAPFLTIAMSIMVTSGSSAAGRFMMLNSEQWVQVTLMFVVALLEFCDRAFYLKKVSLIDRFVCIKLKKMTEDDFEDWLAGVWFQDSVSADFFFGITSEVCAITGASLLAYVSWDDARYFFDLYGPNGSPGVWSGVYLFLQLLLECIVTILSLPLQTNHLDMKLPLLEFLVRFASRPRLTFLAFTAIFVSLTTVLSSSQIVLKYPACSELVSPDLQESCPRFHLSSESGGIVFPALNTTYCCGWDSYLENIWVHFP